MKNWALLFCWLVTVALIDNAQASRNGSGTYSLPAGNPVVTGTTISSTWANGTLSDLSTEMTDSLSRSGKGGMLAALRGIDGTVASPALSFTNETGSGLYRIGASDYGFALQGTKTFEFTTSGFRLNDGSTGIPSLSFINDATAGLWRAGANDFRFEVGGLDKTFWNATGFGIGVVPTTSLHVLRGGSSGATPNNGSAVVIEQNTTNYMSLLAPNANSEAIIFGDVANATRGQIQYYNSTNGSADQMQFATGGATVRLTLSNNGIQGNGGSTITAWSRGGCTLNGGSPSTCTLAVTAGQTCSASFAGTTAPPNSGLRTNNPAGTVTVTGANGLTDGVNVTCF
jgi:hypothetical protein